MELAAFLELLMTWVAGAIAWWLIDHIKWFASLQPDTKRYAAYGFTFLIAGVAYVLLILIGERVAPVGIIEWAKQLFYVGTSAFGLATILNGQSLRKYRTG